MLQQPPAASTACNNSDAAIGGHVTHPKVMFPQEHQEEVLLQSEQHPCWQTAHGAHLCCWLHAASERLSHGRDRIWLIGNQLQLI